MTPTEKSGLEAQVVNMGLIRARSMYHESGRGGGVGLNRRTLTDLEGHFPIGVGAAVGGTRW